MSIFSRKTVEVQEPLLDHTVYLIDTENVRTVWTLLLDRMTVNDKIYVFYTMNSGNVSYEDLNGVISSGKSVELIQCHTGKNGLDFQLVSYLGYLIRNNENADYCIISDDSGYDAVIKFWEGRDVDVTRKTAFQVSGKQAKSAKKPLFGGKSRVKTQPVKQDNANQDNTKQVNSKHANVNQANVNKANVKAAAEVADVANTTVTAKVQPESEKKVRAAKQRTDSENKTGSAKTSAVVGKTVHAKYSRQIKADAINENTADSDLDDIFKDEPVRLTRVNPDQIKFVAQPKDDDTMQSSSSSSDMNDGSNTISTDDNTRNKAVTEKTSSDKKSSARKTGSRRSEKPSKQEAGKASSEPDLSIKSASQKAAVSSIPEMLSKLRGYLPEEPEDRIGEIAGIIAKSGGKNGLADIHDEIEKLYRNEKASDIYRAIRKNIKDICC